MKGEKIMKTGYKFIAISIVAVLFASCADSFLQRDPYGSVITQEQYDKLANKLAGSMRGIYSMMYAVSDHDEFGKRSIDMYTDLMCGDMALTNYSYGWFYQDEQGQGRTARTYYLWSFYYGMLHNVNAVIFAAQGGGAASADNVIKRIGAYGLPTTHATKNNQLYYYTIDNGDTVAVYTEEEAIIANCYAQALTMRGYIYSNLLMLYCEQSYEITDDFANILCFPMYTEQNMEEAQPLATMAAVYTQMESDLTNAIDYFLAFETIERDETKKLEVNAPVACGILAYAYLNKAKGSLGRDEYNIPNNNAIQYAQQAILLSNAEILSSRDLTSSGFNDVNNASWMWGQDVTVETAGGLASFFGQVDIHSYSYAWAGDTKAIDENLYNSIYTFDARKNWFNDGKKNTTYRLCPDGKFFSALSPRSTKSDDIDRKWLSDNVFMRIEAMYLIAAEASYRMGDDAQAISYLTAITDNRVEAGFEDEYDTWKAGLNHSNLLAELEYNWRVEMWGEGYGLQTFRRLGRETITKDQPRKRGGNHCANAGSNMEPGEEYTFQMPSSEGSYNPKIGTTTL